MQRQTKNGFTLIELMIVIAIIGILAAIAIPAYGNYIKRSKFSEVIAASAGIKLALEICYAQKASLTPCDDNTAGNGSSSDPEVSEVRGDALNGVYVSFIDVVYFNPSHVRISIRGTDAVDNATYHLKGEPFHSSLVWGLDEASANCDDLGLC